MYIIESWLKINASNFDDVFEKVALIIFIRLKDLNLNTIPVCYHIIPIHFTGKVSIVIKIYGLHGLLITVTRLTFKYYEYCCQTKGD